MMDFIYQYQLHYIFRILLSGLCGIIIGYERKNRAKEAGLRTHCIVACASALMMIVSKYAFFDMITGDLYPGVDIRLDPSRMAQGIVSGVGFLGAGMIFVRKNTIKGLTTAAGIWATSGIGMAIGGGMYIVGIVSTGIILFVQIILHTNFRFTNSARNKRIKFFDVKEEGFQESITKKMAENNISVSDVSVERKTPDSGLNYTFYVEVFSDISEEKMLSLSDYACIIES